MHADIGYMENFNTKITLLGNIIVVTLELLVRFVIFEQELNWNCEMYFIITYLLQSKAILLDMDIEF